MLMPSRSLQILAGAALFCITAIFTAYLYFSSPRVVLKYALNLQTIPKSVRNLKMGSDVWTDEVRCFYLTIAPDEFGQLLTGRNYQTIDGPSEAETMHISPRMKISGNLSFLWETNSTSCGVFPDDTHEHVIIIFSAD